MKPQYFVGTFVALVVTLISAACDRRSDRENLVGQRLLGFQIKVDGDVRYTGLRSVNADLPASEVWDVLSTVEFEAKSDGEPQAHAGEMVSQTVSGSIVVRFAHGDFGDERTIDRLSLRSENGGKSWSLRNSEVERLKMANRTE